ncbi:MAG: ZIP family metal transporter [Bacteroidales bacterium]|nr:ZIP family metal transporter [Bacteroidales bacterium]
MNTQIFLGLLLPFAGTSLGAAMVYLLKDKLNSKVEQLLLGFASGIMIAASVWSLIIPSLNMATEQGTIAWLPAAVGFMSGILFLLLLDYLIPHLHKDSEKAEGKASNISKVAKLALAVTLHNIPEGMAVGVVFAGFLAGDTTLSLAAAFTLSIGIAIQNFPEGAIISMPLKTAGKTKHKSFFIGVLSGAVEPVFALITILLTGFITPVLPYLLAFAAGAMIYVVVEELIPERYSGGHSNLCVIGVGIGFTLMMVLDVALG